MATEFRQPSAIDAGHQLFGCRVQQSSLIAILLALDVVRRSKEKHFLLLSYSSLIMLGGGDVDHDTIYKYIKGYTILVKQLYSAESPVTWGSLETRKLIR